MADNNNNKEPCALLTRKAVARELGIDPATVRRYEALGLLPPVVKAPTCSRWARADVERIKAGVLAPGGAK